MRKRAETTTNIAIVSLAAISRLTVPAVIISATAFGVYMQLVECQPYFHFIKWLMFSESTSQPVHEPADMYAHTHLSGIASMSRQKYKSTKSHLRGNGNSIKN